MVYLYFKQLGNPEWIIHSIHDDEAEARKAGRLIWFDVSAIRIDVIVTVVEEIRETVI